jgi:hypothetical protein
MVIMLPSQELRSQRPLCNLIPLIPIYEKEVG